MFLVLFIFCITKVEKALTKRQILNKITKYNKSSNLSLIGKAYDVCVKMHSGQLRKSGEPYSTHPIAVANLVIDMQLDDSTIITALLHDVIEDTELTKEDLKREFSPKIADLVDGVTKLDKIKFELDHIRQSENFRKLFIALSKDIRVVIVKLCDRVHNMRTIDCLNPPKQRRIAIETLEIYTPLAARLGMYQIKNELQNLCFKVLNPIARDSIVKRLRSLKIKYGKAIKSDSNQVGDIVSTIETLFSSIIKEHGLNVTVIGREKEPYSIWTKINQKKISFDKLSDIIAFRIVCQSVDECYRILGIIHQKYHAVPNVLTDYISTPKENGYRSVHTVIFGPFGQKIEIQIRTEEMNLDAEYGLASHWSYKQKVLSGKYSLAQKQAAMWIKRVLEIVNDSDNANELMETAKLEMYNDEIFTFTPKGKILNLPQNSTVLDFAFMVDTSLGMHCAGAKIDGKTVPLNHEVANGDVVEIIKSKKVAIKLEDLNNCITSKAHKIISHYTKKEKNDLMQSQGKKILEKIMQSIGIYPTRESLLTIFAASGIKDNSVLLINIAKGILNPIQIVQKAFPDSLPIGKQSNINTKSDLEIRVRRTNIQPPPMEIQSASLISGISQNLCIKFCDCCNPHVGQLIVGHVMEGYPVFIHHKNCSILEDIHFEEREIIPLSWKKS